MPSQYPNASGVWFRLAACANYLCVVAAVMLTQSAFGLPLRRDDYTPNGDRHINTATITWAGGTSLSGTVQIGIRMKNSAGTVISTTTRQGTIVNGAFTGNPTFATDIYADNIALAQGNGWIDGRQLIFEIYEVYHFGTQVVYPQVVALVTDSLSIQHGVVLTPYTSSTTTNSVGVTAGEPPVDPRECRWEISGVKFGTASASLVLLVNGQTIPVTIPGNESPHGAPFDSAVTLTDLPGDAGVEWVVKWNGATVASGTNLPEDPSPIDVYLGNQGDPNKEPPPTPEERPEEQPAPGGSQAPVVETSAPNAPPPPPSPGSGGSAISGNTMGRGDVHVLNTNDFYAPFKQAIMDAAAATMPVARVSFSAAVTPVDGESILPATISTAPDVDETKATVVALTGKVGELRDGLVAKLPGPLVMPTGFGTNYSFTIPLFGSHTVNFQPFMQSMSLIRMLLLVVLTVGFWCLTVRTIRNAFA
jgi:hypothetical protein